MTFTEYSPIFELTISVGVFFAEYTGIFMIRNFFTRFHVHIYSVVLINFLYNSDDLLSSVIGDVISRVRQKTFLTQFLIKKSGSVCNEICFPFAFLIVIQVTYLFVMLMLYNLQYLCNYLVFLVKLKGSYCRILYWETICRNSKTCSMYPKTLIQFKWFFNHKLWDWKHLTLLHLVCWASWIVL